MKHIDVIIDNYPQIQRTVAHKAFKFYVNEQDLMSAVNMRLAVNISNNQFEVMHINQIWGYIHMLINSCAIDIKRRIKHTVELEDCKVAVFNDVDNMLTMRKIIAAILSDITKERDRKAFMEVLVKGCKYEEVATDLGVDLNTLKGIIFRIRKRSIEKYGQAYKQLIA